MARLGRDDCPDLSRVLADWDGRFSPLIRKRVARHVDSCEVCGAARRKLASPLALLAAVPPMPAPAYLRGRVLERVQLTAGSGSGGGGSEGGEPGAPQPQSPMSGPPEGESSRRADPGVSDIHSPLLGAGAGTAAGAGAGTAAGSGKGRRRMVVAGL
ncbi:MAG: putative polymerase subfamily sigma factor, partial [Actinomycetia bacterium]|nr:putative polymerase subfamily sigma factor [Actinomycetes bacterium]